MVKNPGFFQRTCIQFQAPTPGGWQLLITPISGDQVSADLLWGLHACDTNTPSHPHTQIQINKYVLKRRKSLGGNELSNVIHLVAGIDPVLEPSLSWAGGSGPLTSRKHNVRSLRAEIMKKLSAVLNQWPPTESFVPWGYFNKIGKIFKQNRRCFF